MARGGFAQWGNDLYTGRRSYPIIQKRRVWFSIVGLFSVASILILVFQGLNLGIDFRGGSEFTVSGTSDTDQDIAIDTVAEVAPGHEPHVTQVGPNGVRVQVSQLDNDQTTALQNALGEAYGVEASEVTANFIGPTWGQSVSMRALWGTVVFVLAAAVFMAIYFRAWRMSVAAIVAMLLDVLVSAGVYALIGWEVTPSTIIGFLTILGFSLYDKMVVFDKVRENSVALTEQTRSTYAERANLAVNQTLVRSINTSVVALLPVAGILFVGGFLLGAGTLKDISLSLFVGIAVGATSSIFSPRRSTWRCARASPRSPRTPRRSWTCVRVSWPRVPTRACWPPRRPAPRSSSPGITRDIPLSPSVAGRLRFVADDMTDVALSGLLPERATRVRDLIVDVPDFPSPGILFKDITPLLADAEGLADVIEAFTRLALADGVDVVAGMEARGFLLGTPVAHALGLGFLPLRKAGKLPPPTESVSYDLEYGSATIELRSGTLTPGARVLIIDDVLATGGTAAAAAQLVEQCGGVVAGLAFLLELEALHGRDRLQGHNVDTLLRVGTTFR
jgi:preprotein translocase subunit SecF